MLAIQGYKGHLAYIASRAVNYIVQSQHWIFLPVNQSMIVRLLRLIDSFSSSTLTKITVFKLVGTVFYKNYSISFVNISTSHLRSVQFYLPSCHRRGKEATSNEIMSIQYHEVDHRSAAPKPVKTQLSARIKPSA